MISAETNNGGGVRRYVNELRRTLAAEWTRSSTLRGLGGRILYCNTVIPIDTGDGGGTGSSTRSDRCEASALKAVEDLTDIEAVVAALRKQKGGAAV